LSVLTYSECPNCGGKAEDITSGLEEWKYECKNCVLYIHNVRGQTWTNWDGKNEKLLDEVIKAGQ